jgi:hypothetical protein
MVKGCICCGKAMKIDKFFLCFGFIVFLFPPVDQSLSLVGSAYTLQALRFFLLVAHY